LRELGEAAAPELPALIDTLRCDVRNARYQAASVILYIGDKATPAIPALVEMLENGEEDPTLRSMAASALSRLGDGALPTLCRLLHHPDPFIRRKAAGAFQTIGADGLVALPHLVELLNDPDSSCFASVGTGICLRRG
jgi:HEAT repeat protein